MEFNKLYGLYNYQSETRLINRLVAFYNRNDKLVKNLVTIRRAFRYPDLLKYLYRIQKNSKSLGLEKLNGHITRLTNYIKRHINTNEFYVWDYMDKELYKIMSIYESTYKSAMDELIYTKDTVIYNETIAYANNNYANYNYEDKEHHKDVIYYG